MKLPRWLKKKIKKTSRNITLKRTERKWGLYNEKPELHIDWMFSFIDQFKIGGHCNNTIIYNYQKTMSSNVVVTNLNKRIDEEIIISTMNHEAIHIAIFNCLKNSFSFVEKVIEDWITNERLVCNGWNANIKIIKRK